MDASPLDVIVADGGLGSLVVGYLLAARGRSVGIVEWSPPTGTTAVSVLSAGRVDALRDFIHGVAIVSRRSAVVLQPEGGLSVGMASERFDDAAHAVAIVERSTMAEALVEAIQALGGPTLRGDGSAVMDASGAVVGVRAVQGHHDAARCTILDPTNVERLVGMRDEPPRVPAWALETEWRFALDAEVIRGRFSVTERGAAEWRLFGDPLDGARGCGRLRAFGRSVALGVVVPLDEVLGRRIDVDGLGERLRAHPFIAPLLDGAVLTEVSGVATSMSEPRPDALVGDGWVLGPVAHPFDAAPLSTEIAMAEAIAEAIDDALASGRVTSARLSVVPKRLQAAAAAARLVPAGPIDAWADELMSDPTGIVDGLRSVAVRFAGAG